MITIHRNTSSRSGKVRVTFAMPATDCGDGLYLVGWFDEWDETVYPMERTADGAWALTLELEPGCEYQYRFRTPDGRWLQDPALPPAGAKFGLNNSFVISSENLAT
jgi:1,4-alpha-glucan branching enzyme